MNDTIQVTEEYSKQQAVHIEAMKIQLQCLDIPYLREAAIKMRHHANMSDTLAVLNRGYNSKKVELYRLQASILDDICNLHERLTLATEIKEQVRTHEETMAELAKMLL